MQIGRLKSQIFCSFVVLTLVLMGCTTNKPDSPDESGDDSGSAQEGTGVHIDAAGVATFESPTPGGPVPTDTPLSGTTSTPTPGATPTPTMGGAGATPTPTATASAPGCGGTLHKGFCFYVSKRGESCADVCGGGNYDAQATAYAAANIGNCSEVSRALDYSGSVETSTRCVAPATQMGCHVYIYPTLNNEKHVTWCSSGVTMGSKFDGGDYYARRFCGCLK